jgi:hypothetical protein
VVDIVGDIADVMLTSPSIAESPTLPFIREDGEWNLA